MRNFTDPLDIPAGECADVPPSASHFDGRFPKQTLFDGRGFFNYLNAAHNTKLWVMTYTSNENCYLYLPIERLIYSIGTYDREQVEEAHQLIGIHTKLYLQFVGKKLDSCYMGSMNLVNATNANLMFRLPKTHNPFIQKYFLHFWNQQ